MDFHFTEEQDQFRDVVRRFLADTSPTHEVRRLMASDAGFDHGVWQRLSGELALTGLGVPEPFGGAGFGMIELGIAMEEMGRALLCAPYLASSILTAKALEHIASEEQKSRLLPGIASGETIGALAVTEPDGRPDLDAIALTAEREGEGEGEGEQFVLNGRKKFVLDGCAADLILVAARTPGSTGSDGISLFEVSPDATGLTRTPLTVIDPTRRQASLQFDNVPAGLLGSLEGAAHGLRHTLDLAAIALANEMVGGAERLFDDTIEYTRMRVQFGRSIGSFQAIKHRLADLLMTVELAKSSAYYAAAAVDAADLEVPMLASLAKANASEAYLQAATEAIQLHGGIGFTWDHDTHLWFKRAKSSEVLLGDPTWHRERMISEIFVREQRA